MTWRDQDVLIKDKWEDKKDGGQLFPSVQPVVWIKAKQGGGVTKPMCPELHEKVNLWTNTP